MSSRLPLACAATLAGTTVAAYLIASSGAGILPGLATACGLLAGLLLQHVLRDAASRRPSAPAWVWGLVVASVLGLLLWLAWPMLLPPGAVSDLTHHLMLMDYLERTGRLVEGVGRDGELGEMAHYTPGIHLLTVVAGALTGMPAYRVAYPLLTCTVALKAGFVFLIAGDVLATARARLPLAVTAVALVLFAPRAYSLDSFLQAGFYAQVASELFVVAGWWALARWWLDPAPAWLAFVGFVGAAVFLVWPIWMGPLMLSLGVALLVMPRLSWRARVGHGALAVVPVIIVAAMHLVRHAEWLRLAGTSGAVPAIVPSAAGVLLMALALIGAATGWRRPEARITLWIMGGILLQGAALWLLARARGAETPYMAMKMAYLAVYPVAVLGAAGLGAALGRLPATARGAAWTALAVVLAIGFRGASATPVPPTVVDLDLVAAGRWARDHLQPACVDYVVDDAEQAYWLHLAVMGQPRASARTAAIDGYTANRAVGRWIEGSALPYAIAKRDLLPGEVLRDAERVRQFGSVMVIGRSGAQPCQ